MDQKLLYIAKATRAELESFALKYTAPDCWGVGSGEHHRVLQGYCGIASYFLRMVASSFGYKVDMVTGAADGGYGINHSWNVYNRNIIDLTATQFWCSAKKVHVTKITNPRYFPKHINAEALKNFHAWSSQSPFAYIGALRYRRAKLIKKLRCDTRKYHESFN